MFLPLIYPDYTMVCESLFMEPCVLPLHLSICVFSADCTGNYTVSYTGQTFTSPNLMVSEVKNQSEELEISLRVFWYTTE